MVNGRCPVSIPGFRAHASLYKMRTRYRLVAGVAEGKGVLAQAVPVCPHKGCGPCVQDSTSLLGGRRCCCHPPFDPEIGCDPDIVECVPDQQPPPPPPVDCGTHLCPSGFCCCGLGDCCPPGHPCCVHSCPAGAYCCSDGDGCCPSGWKCRSYFGVNFCSPI